MMSPTGGIPLVGVEDGHQGDLRQVEPLTQQIDARRTSNSPRRKQTGLSCSEPNHRHMPLSLPRKSPTESVSGTPNHQAWPLPRHERPGSSIVSVTMLRDSLQPTAHTLGPTKVDFDTPFDPPSRPRKLGVRSRSRRPRSFRGGRTGSVDLPGLKRCNTKEPVGGDWD